MYPLIARAGHTRTACLLTGAAVFSGSLLAAPARRARADVPAVAATAPAPAPAPAPSPPPYSLPWQLWPVTVGNVVRADSTTAVYKDGAGNTGTTVATMLLASYKVTAEFAPVVRLGFVRNGAPGRPPTAAHS